MLVILAGQPGTGKTTVRHLLAHRLYARGLGPDDHPERWNWVHVHMDISPRVILECCRIPGAVVRKMPSDTSIVHLTARLEVRRQRIEQQGHGRLEVEQRLRNSETALGYDREIQPTFSIDTSDLDPVAIAELIDQKLSETPLESEVRQIRGNELQVRHTPDELRQIRRARAG